MTGALVTAAARHAGAQCPSLRTLVVAPEGLDWEALHSSLEALEPAQARRALQALHDEVLHAVAQAAGPAFAHTLQAVRVESGERPTPARANFEALVKASHVLAGFVDTETTLPVALGTLTAALPLEAAVLRGAPDAPDACWVWLRPTLDSTARDEFVRRAHAAWAYLCGEPGAPPTAPPARDALLPGAASEAPTCTEGVALPLGTAARPFGVLWLQPARTPSEDDLALLAAFASQLAGVLPRGRTGASLLGGALDELVAVISHDLRNPLSAILMSTALLLRGSRPVEGQRQLELIKRSGQRMNHMLQNLLEAARLDAGTVTLQPSAQDPAPLVSECVRLLQGQADSRSVRLACELSETAGTVYADRDRVLLALANLVTAALRGAAAGSTLTLRVERQGEMVRFAVRDPSARLAAEDTPRLFDRAWWSARGAGLGTGLGLCVARRLVEAHGGRIGAEVDASGGSTLWFTLPAAPNPLLHNLTCVTPASRL
jgi:signal transduction histidine kinase